MYKFKSLILLSTILAFLTGCATIVDGGGTKPLTISSNPTGVNFELMNKDGIIIHKGVTPVTYNLPRGAGVIPQSYSATFYDDEGNVIGTKTASSTPTGWFIVGNFIFGGLIGWTIDAFSGNMYTISPNTLIYP